MIGTRTSTTREISAVLQRQQERKSDRKSERSVWLSSRRLSLHVVATLRISSLSSETRQLCDIATARVFWLAGEPFLYEETAVHVGRSISRESFENRAFSDFDRRPDVCPVRFPGFFLRQFAIVLVVESTSSVQIYRFFIDSHVLFSSKN